MGTFYVAADADGTGDGSQGDPWDLEQMRTSTEAGDTVFVRTGNYSHSGAFVPVNDGEITNPVWIIGYKDNPGDLDEFQGWVATANGMEHANKGDFPTITIIDHTFSTAFEVTHWYFKNMHLTNNDNGSNRSLLHGDSGAAFGSAHSILYNCALHHKGSATFARVIGGSSSETSLTVCHHCEIRAENSNNIWIITSFGNSEYKSALVNCIIKGGPGCGGVNWRRDDGYIIGCVFEGFGESAIIIDGWRRESICSHNTFVKCDDVTIHFPGSATQRFIVQNNIFADCERVADWAEPSGGTIIVGRNRRIEITASDVGGNNRVHNYTDITGGTAEDEFADFANRDYRLKPGSVSAQQGQIGALSVEGNGNGEETVKKFFEAVRYGH